jgi:hypothetical protein
MLKGECCPGGGWRLVSIRFEGNTSDPHKLTEEDQIWMRNATLYGEKETGMSFALSTVNVWMMRSKDYGRTGIVTIVSTN